MRPTEEEPSDEWADLVGNQETRDNFLRWLDRWKSGQTKKAALIYGPPGTGKTATVQFAARKLGYNLVELNASDVRTKDALMERVYPASRSRSLYNERNVILLDEIDGLHRRQDTGGASAILKLIRDTETPVVLVANNPWEPSLRDIRGRSEMFKFTRLRKDLIIKRLTATAAKLGLSVNEMVLEGIAERARGDMRSAMADLQALASGGATPGEEAASWILQERIKEEDIFEALRGAMQSKSLYEARTHLSNTGLQVYDIIDWVYGNAENIAASPDEFWLLSRAVAEADYLSALMKRLRTWMLISYIYDILSVGLVACGRGATRWMRLGMPNRISHRWARYAKAKERAALAVDIGTQLHERRSVVVQETIPLLGIIGRRVTTTGRERGKATRPKSSVRSRRSKARGR